MNPEVFAEWLRRMGHRVVRTRSSYWFDAGPRVFQAFPYHWIIQPTEEELREFLCEQNAIALRYSTPIDADVGACSYHIVYERSTYDLQDVDSSVRGQVRRSLGSCSVGPITLERYAREGWSIERDTQARQHRRSRRGRERWEQMVRAAEGLDGFQVFGAEVEGKLAATLMCVPIDGCIDMLYQQSLREYLPLRVNNALLFDATRTLVARPDVHQIHNGLHSLDAPASVDKFKIRLGYSVKPIRQRVMFHPRLAPFFGSGTSSLLEGLAGHFPENESIQKANGLMKFYLNGRLSLIRQPFPENLERDKEAIVRGLDLPSMMNREVLSTDGQKISIGPATPADIASLTALHLAIFSKIEHLALKLGRPFIRAVYRWFVTSPGTLVLVARHGDRLVGFTAFSDRPYNMPMLRACKWQVLLGLLRRPWLMLRPDWLYRLASHCLTKKGRSLGKVAQIAFTGIAADLQGQGLGRALKHASIEVCREWGAETVVTGVLRENVQARVLNESAGFLEVPELSSRRLVHLRLDLTTFPPAGALLRSGGLPEPGR